MPSPPRADLLPALARHRPFAFFWSARVAGTIGYQMQAVAIGWQIYDLTGSALDLGLVGLVQFIPVVALALVVGHVADRYERRRVVRACQLAEALAAAVLATGSVGGWLTEGAIFAIVLVIGKARAFELPALHALVPGLVPAEMFARAVAGSASANQIAIITGPALGGVVYAAGPAAVYGSASALFLGAGVLISLIRVAPARLATGAPTLASLFAGLAFIRSRPALLGAISLDLFAVLLGGATALLPIYARDILHSGPWGLGLLRSAPAFGALAASLVLARRPLRGRAGAVMFASVACFGAATMVFGVSASFPISLAALAVLGASDALSVVIRFSLVQIATPDEMRGRVSAVNSLFIGTSNTLGEFESGVTAAWFGVVPAVLIGGIGTVLVALIGMRLFPELRRIDLLERVRPERATTK
ncbi:MAG TPA: MFS transporter [Stellaceae bacterium]|nr:MFS transporter [Stellaceae bacterium]